MKKSKMKKIFNGVLAGILLLGGTFIFPLANADAQTADASLYFSPSSTSVSLNGTVSVKIMVNSGGGPINTVTVDFTYPSDLLQLVSIDSSNSVFNGSAESDYTAGTAYITRFIEEGETYTGTGEVTTINFRGIAAGTATLSFTGDAVVMDADTATDILGDTNSGTISVSSSTLPSTGLFDKPVVLFATTISLLLITMGIIGILQYTEDRKNSLHIK